MNAGPGLLRQSQATRRTPLAATHSPTLEIMNTLLRWNPLNELNEMQNKLANIFAHTAGNNGERTIALPDWSLDESPTLALNMPIAV